MRKIKLITGFMLVLLQCSNISLADQAELDKALLLKPESAHGVKIYALCGTCHGKQGWGKPDGSFPVIAGQHRKVIIKQLADIRARNRANPTMFPFADPQAIGGAQSIADVAEYITTLKMNPEPGQGKGDNLKHGGALYTEHCITCHGKDGAGNADAFFPRLMGQHFPYLNRQMLAIRDGGRKNANAEMVRRLKLLKDEDLEALSDYISRLPISPDLLAAKK